MLDLEPGHSNPLGSPPPCAPPCCCPPPWPPFSNLGAPIATATPWLLSPNSRASIPLLRLACRCRVGAHGVARTFSNAALASAALGGCSMHVLDCLAAALPPRSHLTAAIDASDNLLAADCRDCGWPLRSQDHLICKGEQPPAMADLNVTNYRIDARQYTMPRIDLRDRRSGGRRRRWRIAPSSQRRGRVASAC